MIGFLVQHLGLGCNSTSSTSTFIDRKFNIRAIHLKNLILLFFQTYLKVASMAAQKKEDLR